MKNKIISICAKCSDLCSMTYEDREHDGYVPEWMPGNHYGDYIMLNIDVTTGKIVNWKVPTDSDLEETFGKS